MTREGPAMRSVLKSLMVLRLDAKERGMQELCIVYGWSAIRLGFQMIADGQRISLAVKEIPLS